MVEQNPKIVGALVEEKLNRSLSIIPFTTPILEEKIMQSQTKRSSYGLPEKESATKSIEFASPRPGDCLGRGSVELMPMMTIESPLNFGDTNS